MHLGRGERSAACSAAAVRAKILFALSIGENSWLNPEMLSVRPSSRKPGWFKA